MKSERRHELKESDLLHAIESGKKYMQGHGRHIGLILLAAIFVVVASQVVMSSRSADAQSRWVQLATLSFEDEPSAKQSLGTLLALSQESTSNSFTVQALITRGSRALEEFAKSSPADAAFNDIAKDSYTRLLSRFSTNPLAFGVANLGLATVAENAFVIDGNASHKDTAKQHLDAIVANDKCATLPVYQQALDRQQDLNLVFTKVTFAPPLPKEEPKEAEAMGKPEDITTPPGFTVTPVPAKKTLIKDLSDADIKKPSGETGNAQPVKKPEDEAPGQSPDQP